MKGTEAGEALVLNTIKQFEALEELLKWQPIDTAPKNNQELLLLGKFKEGKLVALAFDVSWEVESESWELPREYYYWAGKGETEAFEDPTHWMFQPFPSVLPEIYTTTTEMNYDADRPGNGDDLVRPAVHPGALQENGSD